MVARTPDENEASIPHPRRVVLGRYVLLSVLGKGGMAVVYSAYDPELDRKVALKLVKPGHSGDSEWQARLMREAQAMARLHHPNVLSVHDVGEHEGQVFVAMPLVEGGTLRQWLARAPRPKASDVLDVFLRAGRGLSAAHAAGVVHRDFKPDNVLCGELSRGVPGLVVVTDFGLARLNADEQARGEPSGGVSSLQTVTGAVFGTPRYMAPEQARGEVADARSDQFSFGVALHDALFGTLPYERAEPLDPSTWRATFARGGSLPTRARQALIRSVSLSPADRFGSMDELLAELSPAPWAVRRWPVVVAAAVVAIASVALAKPTAPTMCTGAQRRVGAVFSEADAAQIRQRYLATGLPFAEQAAEAATRGLAQYGARWASMHTEACTATRIRGEQSEELLDLRVACLDTRLSQMKTLVGAMKEASAELVPTTLAALSSLGDLEACADTERLKAPAAIPPSTKPIAAKIRADLAEARTLRYLARMQESEPRIEQALAEARASGSEVLLAEALFERGDLFQFLEDYPAADRALREALLEADASRHDDVRAKALAQLAATSAKAGEPERAVWWYDSARAALRRRPSASLRIDTALPLGEALVGLGRVTEARAHYEKSYAEADALLGGSDVRTLELALGLLDSASERDDDGWLIERLQAECDLSWGQEHTCQALVRGYRGDRLVRQGRCDDGLGFLREALFRHEKASGEAAPSNVADALHWVAAALECSGQPAEARDTRLREASVMVEAGLPPCSAALPRARAALSMQLAGDATKALATSADAVAACAGQPLAQQAPVACARAWVLLRGGEPSASLDLFREAADNDETRAEALWGQGEALLRAGRAAEAAEVLEQSLGVSVRYDPFVRPLVRLALGKALWESGRDRCRARALHTEAASLLEGYQGERARTAVAEARAWLATHPEMNCGS